MGRPRVPETERKNKYLFTMTAGDREWLQKLARRRRTSMSAVLRSLIRNAYTLEVRNVQQE